MCGWWSNSLWLNKHVNEYLQLRSTQLENGSTKLSVHKYKKGKDRRPLGTGGIKSLSERQFNTQQSYIDPIFLWHQYHTCSAHADLHHGHFIWQTGRAAGAGPTRRLVLALNDRQIGLAVRYHGSKRFSTSTRFFWFFGIVWKITTRRYKQERDHVVYTKQ